MKKITTIVMLFLMAGVLQVRAADGFANGTGTEQDPYQITSQEELDLVRNFKGEDNIGKYFILMNDIALTGNWTPIGSAASTTNSFMATFDGNGKTVSGLQMSVTASGVSGLFGVVYYPAVIKNLTVTTTGDGIVSTNQRVGILIGQSGNGATVKTYPGPTVVNCTVSGRVSGTTRVGGLIGMSKSIVVNCSAKNVVVTSSGGYAGGLLGSHMGAYNVKNCSASGTVTVTNDQQRGGGLIGIIEACTDTIVSDTISHCHTDVIVSATNASAGLIGEIGENDNSHTVVEYSSAIAVVTLITGTPGGLIGKLGNAGKSTVRYCSAMANVRGNTYVGGFAGWFRGKEVNNCYATGYTTSIGGGTGGFFGAVTLNGSSVSNSYASVKTGTETGRTGPFFRSFEGDGDITTSGIFYNSDLTGGIVDTMATPLTTSEMRAIASFPSFQDANWTSWEGKSMPYFTYQTTPVSVVTSLTGITVETKNTISEHEVFEVRNSKGEVIFLENMEEIDDNTQTGDFPTGSQPGDIFYIVAKEPGKAAVATFFDVPDNGSSLGRTQRLTSVSAWFDAAGSLLVNVNEPFENVCVVDINGKIVYAAASGQRVATIPAQRWPVGTYIVRAMGSKGVYTAKAVKTTN